MAARSRSPALPAPDLPDRIAAGVPPVVVLAGADRWFREEGIRRIVRAVLPDGDPGAALVRLDARRSEDQAGVAAALDEVRSASLFGGGKVVVVENAEAAEGAWSRGAGKTHPVLALAEAVLAHAGSASVLVLVTAKGVKGAGAVPTKGLVDRGALVVDCRALYDAPGPWSRGARPWDHELARFLARRMQQAHGKRLDVEDAHVLVQLVGSDLGPLDAALGTLALYVGDAGVVRAEDVEQALGATRSDPAWRLTEAVMDGDRERAFELLAQALSRGVPDARGSTVQSPEALFMYLGSALHGAWRRRLAGAEGLARGEAGADVARAQGVPSFRAEAWLAQCAVAPSELLTRHAAFFDAELGVKGGRVPARVALERLVARLVDVPRRP